MAARLELVIGWRANAPKEKRRRKCGGKSTAGDAADGCHPFSLRAAHSSDRSRTDAEAEADMFARGEVEVPVTARRCKLCDPLQCLLSAAQVFCEFRLFLLAWAHASGAPCKS